MVGHDRPVLKPHIEHILALGGNVAVSDERQGVAELTHNVASVPSLDGRHNDTVDASSCEQGRLRN